MICLFAGLTVLHLAGELDSSLWLAVIMGGALAAAISWHDDHHSLSASRRIRVHVLAAAVAVAILAGGAESAPIASWLPGWLNWLLVVVGLVWLLNLYNFMDGIDGIAAMESISFGVFLVLAGWVTSGESALAGWVVIASVAGFAVWNWAPAKIFMGDVGSAFLGFCLGLLAVAAVSRWSIPLAASLIVLGVFVVDATFTLLVRMATGQRWHEAHRSHAYQYASRQYQSHARVTLSVLAINLFWLIPLALLACFYSGYAWFILLIAYLPLVFLARHFNAGKLEAPAA